VIKDDHWRDAPEHRRKKRNGDGLPDVHPCASATSTVFEPRLSTTLTGRTSLDDEGTELPDIHAARRTTITLSGETLKDGASDTREDVAALLTAAGRSPIELRGRFLSDVATAIGCWGHATRIPALRSFGACTWLRPNRVAAAAGEHRPRASADIAISPNWWRCISADS
jgi:hypothetical protein